MKNKSTLLKVSLLAAIVAMGCLTQGCKSDTHIVSSAFSGDGMLAKVAVPVGSNPNLAIGASLFVGRFNSTVSVLPTSTTNLYAPKAVVYTRAHGKQSVGASASSYAPGSSTTGTGTNVVAAAASGLSVNSPSATITDASGDGSAVVFGDASVTDRSGTNNVMTVNATSAP